MLINGEAFDRVVLATGVTNAPMRIQLYQQLQEELDAPTVDGLPEVDNSLRWVEGENVFLLGANAALELGPGGWNLMGAMRGAKLVAQELRELMWATDTTVSKQGMFVNPFSLLDGDDQSNDESDDESDDGGAEWRADHAGCSKPAPSARPSKAPKNQGKPKKSKANRGKKGGRRA